MYTHFAHLFGFWGYYILLLLFSLYTPTDFCYECVPPLVFALAHIERVKYENFCTALEQLNNMINPAIISNTDVTKWA